MYRSDWSEDRKREEFATVEKCLRLNAGFVSGARGSPNLHAPDAVDRLMRVRQQLLEDRAVLKAALGEGSVSDVSAT